MANPEHGANCTCAICMPPLQAAKPACTGDCGCSGGHTRAHDHQRAHSHDHAHSNGHEDEACQGHAHSQEHGGCSCQEGTEVLDKTVLTRLIVSAVLFLGGILIPTDGYMKLGLFFAALVVIGWDIALNAVRNLFNKRILDENLLMTIACIGAFCLREYAEGVLVMLLYQIGELFQGYAIGNSRKSIRSLIDLRPETVGIERDGETAFIPAGEVRIGDMMVIRPGSAWPWTAW